MFRFSCPGTSQQNDKAERIMQTTTTFFVPCFSKQAFPLFWIELLPMTVHLLNLVPTKVLTFRTPFEVLYNTKPNYEHLRVFGCLCYLNLS